MKSWWSPHFTAYLRTSIYCSQKICSKSGSFLELSSRQWLSVWHRYCPHRCSELASQGQVRILCSVGSEIRECMEIYWALVALAVKTALSFGFLEIFKAQHKHSWMAAFFQGKKTGIYYLTSIFCILFYFSSQVTKSVYIWADFYFSSFSSQRN